MTEERMLRLEKIPNLPNIEFYYCDSDERRKKAYSIDWDDLEPVPPKDWVPSCFMANSSNINKCAFPKRSIERLMNESCENCPFRKLED